MWSSTGRPARRTSSSSDSDPVEARLGLQLDPLAVLAHRVEQAAHLRERRAARLLDVLERLPVRCERVGEPVPDRSDLEHHHADGVGDDVVQLAGDPCALLGDRDAARGVPLALGLYRAHLRRFGLLGALAQREAGEPADREQRRDEDELARGMARGCCRRRSPRRRSRSPGPAVPATSSRRLPSSRAAAMPATKTPYVNGTQSPVDERKRGGQQPEGRGRGEREAPARRAAAAR